MSELNYKELQEQGVWNFNEVRSEYWRLNILFLRDISMEISKRYNILKSYGIWNTNLKVAYFKSLRYTE